jgi:hypothetical protein
VLTDSPCCVTILLDRMNCINSIEIGLVVC